MVVGVGVLPDVKGGQGQAEHRHHAHGPGDRSGRDQPTPVRGQRGPDQLEVGQQVGGCPVVPAGLVRAPLGLAGPGVAQLGVDAGELQSVGLLGVEPAETRIQIGQRGQVGHQRLRELLGDRCDPLRDRQLGAELLDVRKQVADGVVMLDRQHPSCRSRRDERVAVAVTADPGAEREHWRLGRDLDSIGCGRRGELPDDVAGRSHGQVVEVEQGVSRLVSHLRLTEPQLIGLPQQVDGLGDRAVGVGGARNVEQLGDPSQLDQDRAPGRLGRVRGEHGSGADAGEAGTHLGRSHVTGLQSSPDRDPGLDQRPTGRGPGQRLGAGAVHLLDDVRQVEVQGERPRHRGCLIQGQRVDQPGGSVGVVA